MPVAELVEPVGRLSRWRAESTRPSLLAGFAGVAGLGATLVGPIVLVVARGPTPVDRLVATLHSGQLHGLFVAGIVFGAVAAIVGWGTYRFAPTKLAREQAIGGAVLGLQAVIIGALLLKFT